jgi:hypothetical protein
MPTTLFKSAPQACVNGYAVGITTIGSAVCQSSGFSSATYPTETNTLATAVGDFNNDGLPDFVSFADPTTTIATVYLNTGNGYFSQNGTFTVTASIQNVAVGDVNNDGNQDIILTRSLGSATNLYTVCLGSGIGTFTCADYNGSSIYANGIALYDFNGDSKLDMLIGTGGTSGTGTNAVHLYLGNGNGTFTFNTSVAAGANTGSVVIGDWNHSGKMGFAVANLNASTVQVFFNTGTTTAPAWTSNQTISISGSGLPISLITADFNGDGYLDLATANWTSNTITVMLNNGSGSFSVAQTISSQGYTNNSILARYLVARDFNGDGFVDLATASNMGTIKIYLNSGLGAFTLSSQINVGSNPEWIDSADFNLDGRSDIIVSNYGSATNTILLNNSPSMTQQYPLSWATTNTAQNITGQKTFGAQQIFGSGIMIKNKGQGDTWQISSSQVSTGNGTLGSVSSYATSTSPRDLAVADINGDGYPDVVVAAVGCACINIYLNNGNGTYTLTSTITPTNDASAIALGDVDGDGVVDLVAGIIYSDTIVVYRGNGNGTFGLKGTYAVSSAKGPFKIVLADWNLDGYLDILEVGNASPYNIALLTNTGSSSPGVFTVSYAATQGAAYGLAVADINNDGYPDAVIPNNGGSSVYVYLNNTTGGFTSGTSYAVGNSPAEVQLGDVNADGYPDIVAALAGTGVNAIAVLINKGNGTFNTAATYPTGTSPAGLALGDLNGDGRLDVVTVNYGAANVSVLLNAGTGTFPSHTEYTSPGSGSWTVKLTDINKDGILDVVVPGYSTNTLGTLLGTTSSVPSTNILNLQHTAGVTNGAVGIPQLYLPSGSYIGDLTTIALTASRTYMLPDASGTVALTSNLNQCTSLISGSNQPALCANVSSAGNSAAISATNLQCGGTTCPAGLYLFTYYMNVATAASTGTVTLNCGWSDSTNIQSQSSGALSLASSASGNYLSGQCIMRSAGTSNISYSTTVSGLSGTPAYALYASLQRMQ